jgi:hypothetical protein
MGTTTSAETKLLTAEQLVARIKTNMGAFIVVGQDLKALRDGGFKGGLTKFQMEHEGMSMVAYIEKELSITVRYAQVLINESDVALFLQNAKQCFAFSQKSVEPLINIRFPKTDGAKRPDLDFDTIGKIWDRALELALVECRELPTAKIVKKAIASIKAQSKVNMESKITPIDEDSVDLDEDGEEEVAPRQVNREAREESRGKV